MTWTDERVEQLKKLWSQGYSASQIAKDLGGTTRNAVIGKIHRLNLVARQSPKNTPPLLTSAAGLGAGSYAAAGANSSAHASTMAKSKAIAAKLPTAKASDYMAPNQNWAAGYADPGAYKVSQYAGAFSGAAANPFNDDAAKAGTVHNPFKNGRASCQWPVGDPRQQGFHFCGASAQEGCSYCSEHMRMAYQPVQKKRLGLGNTDLHATGTPDEREIIVTF